MRQFTLVRELQTERTAPATDVTANKRNMQELEENLLYKLTTVQGSLVDDEAVIEVLNVTKNKAAEVREKEAVAAEAEVKISTALEEFRPVATRGSVLHFLIVDMAVVNFMYQASLCRGLYEDHKFVFTLLLSLKVDMEREYVSHEEFNTFIKFGKMRVG
ncbi:dynein axonemal heavy chain 5-like [Schistocerca gregaria]|uniref:dynein axonemal heavy chain 5-like n=1 Tax=Schistocerca gregaria TaxID=7010 RepID=UPI00211E0BC4|nr:dynein axonemal heavy chain 5-like [Schistocerca gregaria]